ncbi:receptor-interacting serine/threonine-protein kinase 1 [Orussus abietinus]|uniref:receptor-interacting serine/threonine-protein kinase 1 n=1 Tax=Orussus abietinus TaxID=222816 RepID=UPI00062521BC|nr:receptor-interacting serine/threonine-protein kinase 1 [Orussus abietinus]XP_012276039.1 receptor-interacting serine/threonine-protein kinase 1 [Orussus abietinus]XP_012276040.1 receptor-interacting serine/threonine-protein kinase 1 [Orussus abietinus]XP_012276041.1 receptor-interacting serine/threonine-protein kinase 1 [Orussus abietinus]XP_012276042.1 receptor-interacting serine/threonine-protein kinase 1 [Orussus abietinus]XP_023287633.1 receptor-interacting serine/threonine-protein kina
MPILSSLSKRLHLLTTDSKPDPPRIQNAAYTNNLEPPPSEVRTKSTSSVPKGGTVKNENVNSTSDTKKINTELPSIDNTDKFKKRRTEFKTKASQAKTESKAKVINYNIVNSNGVQIGPKTSYVCNINQFSERTSSSDVPLKPKEKKMTEDVKALSMCKKEITMDDMFLIKTHIGHGWRDVARKLGYSEGQMDQFKENYGEYGINQVIYQILLDWKQANTKDAQLGILVSVMWSCQEYDCVQRLVRMHGLSL